MNNNMRDDDMQDSDPEAVSSHARRLAEQGLHEQAQGHVPRLTDSCCKR